MLYLYLFFISLYITSLYSLNCINEVGKKVDWWVILKIPNSASYVYSDSNNNMMPSVYQINDTQYGAMTNTILQLHQKEKQNYILSNDEPYNSTWNVSSLIYGHSKGVLGYDNKQGFWIVHSFPKFPNFIDEDYNAVQHSQLYYGQSAMCISIDYDSLDTIGSQLQLIRPYIYDFNVADESPQSIIDLANGAYSTAAESSIKEFTSIGGVTYSSLAKTAAWNQSLYPDLVAPYLNANIFVETWIRGDEINSTCPTDGYWVQNVRYLDLFDTDFSEYNDHSKWAISQDADSHAVCVGGVNQMYSQNVRGGGTVCFFDMDLWKSFSSFVTTVEDCEDNLFNGYDDNFKDYKSRRL